MINFHKLGYLDIRKLKAFTDTKNFWLHTYNPNWLFLWSDLYKPEIAFTNEFIFIRFLMPDIGMCYYPPFGNGDLAKGIEIMREDAKENGYDFYIAPISEEYKYEFLKLGIKIHENEQFNSYIYQAVDLSIYSHSKYKKQKQAVDDFRRTYKNAFVKMINKDEFPQVLEFMNDWNVKVKSDTVDDSFFAKLNMIKQAMEHLYELDIIALEISDGEKIIGIVIGTIMNNEGCVHALITMPGIKGAEEELLSYFARSVQANVKYINLESDKGSKELRKNRESYSPNRQEKFYATFSL